MRIQYCYNVEYIFGLWNSCMKGFRDIGSHQYFGQADFFMPELLLRRTRGYRMLTPTCTWRVYIYIYIYIYIYTKISLQNLKKIHILKEKLNFSKYAYCHTVCWYLKFSIQYSVFSIQYSVCQWAGVGMRYLQNSTRQKFLLLYKNWIVYNQDMNYCAGPGIRIRN